MSNVNIRQLKDHSSGDIFYPQTDIHGLVNNGVSAIDDFPTADSNNLVTSGGVASELEALGNDLNMLTKTGTEITGTHATNLTAPTNFIVGDIFYINEEADGGNYSEFVDGIHYYVAKTSGNAGTSLENSSLFFNTYSSAEALRMSLKYILQDRDILIDSNGDEVIDSNNEPVSMNRLEVTIDELNTILTDTIPDMESGARKGETAYQKPVGGIPASDLASGVIPTVPTNVSAFNNDAGYLTQHQDISGKADKRDVEAIEEKIPTQASSTNQLADKDFVNSSISTATADFKGTVNSLSELNDIDANNNDYAFVVVTDENGNTVYKRYKYNGESWVFEYDLNNSSFTAAQWAAIQSGITKELVDKLTPVDYSLEYLTTIALEQGTISFNIWKNMGTEYITSISYSTDNGETWTTTNNTNGKSEHLSITVNVNEGDKVLWKGDAQQTGYYDVYGDDDYVGSFFSSDCEFDVQGNVMSLLYGDNFKGEDTLEYDAQFALLFYDYDEESECKVVNARNLSLPATTLATNCYYRMFQGCTSLTTAPQLPATALTTSCYSGMFQGCTSLTTAPQLPATALTTSCYNCMFQGCTSLITAPELPATTLASNCYFGMFSGCTSLTTAPQLPATTLTNNCYNSMFNGCTRLNSINCLATNISANNCTTNWVNGVASSGTFIKATNMSRWTSGNNGIPNGWTVYTEEEYEVVRHYEIKQSDWNQTDTTANDYIKNKPIIPTNYVIDYSKEYLTFEVLEDGTIDFILYSWADTSYIESIAYSKNDTEWIETQNSDNREEDIVISINVVEGDKIRWKGIANHIGNDGDNGGVFTSTCRFNAQGNIMSLLYGDEFDDKITIENDSVFVYLFNDINNSDHQCLITNASNLVLPATTLADYCYNAMFARCTSLTTAPILPATTLANHCYASMFMDCTSLTTAPQLPATTLVDSCYSGMFFGCTSLTVAPQLPATTLAYRCYYDMFDGCTSLTTAPQLPATTLATNCYESMFSGCTNLTIVQQLPATTLVENCYYAMFRGCTSLTAAPQLPATTLARDCYASMFFGCTSLTTAPQLPATTLADYCYNNMFNKCRSLTEAPILPATTLTNGCYSYMFFGCTKLNTITCFAIPTIATLDNYKDNWVTGVSASGTFIKAAHTEWPTGNNGIPANWTVVTESEWKEVKHYEIISNVTHTFVKNIINNNNIIIWIDDFSSVSVEEMYDNYINGNGGYKQYHLTQDTLTIDNITYYIWESNTEGTEYDYNPDRAYILTTTNDYDELLSQSLSEDLNNNFTSFSGFLNEDSEESYGIDETRIQYILDIEQNNNDLSIYVDNIRLIGFDDWTIDDYINDPKTCGCNPYKLTGDTINIDNQLYYIWENVQGMGFDGYDYSSNVRYLLTTVNDYETLKNLSVGVSKYNLAYKPNSCIFALMDEDNEIYETNTEAKNVIVKVE